MGNGFSFTSTIEGSYLEVALTKKAKNPRVTKKFVFIDAFVISKY